MVDSSQLPGWYQFTHPAGTFEVCLRPGGNFFCPNFQANAKWAVTNEGVLQIAWKKYGNYELLWQPTTQEFSGSLVGNTADWRKMRALRPLAATELSLLGAPVGVGSEWEFQWEGGKFPVEFRGDGFSHFVCNQFPAHAHWTLSGAAADELTIHWAAYGTYELRIAPDGASAEGCEQNKPANWRKMRFLRALDVSQEAQCDGHHN